MSAPRSLFADSPAPTIRRGGPTPTTTAPSGNGDGLGNQIESIFAQIAERTAPTMDADAIRAEITEQIDGKSAELSVLVKTLVEERIAPRSVVVECHDVKREIDGRTHAQFDRLVKLAGARNRNGTGHNILIVGPAGCGKTHAVAQVAEALGLSFGFLSLSGGISESHLIGRYAPTGENGRFEYRPAPFVEFYRNGGVFLLDEIDAADPNVLVVVNAGLANGHLRLPDGTTVDRHADFVCVAAAKDPRKNNLFIWHGCHSERSEESRGNCRGDPSLRSG